MAEDGPWKKPIEEAIEGQPFDYWKVGESKRAGPSGETLVNLQFIDPLISQPEGRFDIELAEDAPHDVVRDTVRKALMKYLRTHPVTGRA